MAFEHKSVLLEETVNGLNIKPDGIYVEGTLGGGGHAWEVCSRLNDKGSFIGSSSMIVPGSSPLPTSSSM